MWFLAVAQEAAETKLSLEPQRIWWQNEVKECTE